MKKVTLITALLAVLMLLVSCGGGAGGNPAGNGGNGGPNPLAGKTFSKTDFLTQEEITWHFDNAGNAR